MTTELEKRLTKLIKSDVLSPDLSGAIGDLLQRVSMQRKSSN
jgi:hypothetical protein